MRIKVLLFILCLMAFLPWHELKAQDTITICKDVRNITFSIKTISGNATSWQWTLTGTFFSGKLNDSICGPVPYNTVGIFQATCLVGYSNQKDSLHKFIINVFDGKVQMPSLKDTVLCGPVNLTLDADNANNPLVKYKWLPNGQTSKTITINSPGTYLASVYTLDDFSYKCTNCVACDSLTKQAVVTRGAKATVDLGPDRFICGDNPAILDAGAGYISYKWLPNNEASQSISVLSSGTYSVSVTNSDGCTASDDIFLKDSCPMYIFAPNAISADFNGSNDVFTWAGNIKIKSYSLRVFNRWGEILFETNDPNKVWNGSYKDELVFEGVYCYLIECRDTNDMRHTLKGTITVLR
jgi:gliding motility-associated-like protein